MQATKSRTKYAVIIAVILAVAVITVGFFAAGHFRLSRALDSMDINSKDSVTRVIKYAKDDPDILYSIAQQYIKNSSPEGAGILLHILQNIDCKNDNAKALLKEYYKSIGADSVLINQVDSAQLIDFSFEVTAEHNGVGYGGIDGIYCSDFDGLICFKLSSARPKSISAYKDGVYFLDSADSRVKTLSYDGASAKTVLTDTSEFVYFESFIYSIDNSGQIHAPNEITLGDGEFCANLRVDSEGVLCDIYNESYELINTITLD